MKSKIIAGLLIIFLPVLAEKYEDKGIEPKNGYEKDSAWTSRSEVYAWKYGMKEKVVQIAATLYPAQDTLKVVQNVTLDNHDEGIVDSTVMSTDPFQVISHVEENGGKINDPAIQNYLVVNFHSALLVHLPLDAYLEANDSASTGTPQTKINLWNEAAISNIRTGLYITPSGVKRACYIVTINQGETTAVYWIETGSRRFLKAETVLNTARITIVAADPRSAGIPIQ